MNFETGQTVFIKPGTWHNPTSQVAFDEVKFISYMAGREYCVLQVRTYDGYRNIRARVEDLD